jgi:hypothetical protein
VARPSGKTVSRLRLASPGAEGQVLRPYRVRDDDRAGHRILKKIMSTLCRRYQDPRPRPQESVGVHSKWHQRARNSRLGTQSEPNRQKGSSSRPESRQMRISPSCEGQANHASGQGSVRHFYGMFSVPLLRRPPPHRSLTGFWIGGAISWRRIGTAPHR